MKDTVYRQDVIEALICADENIGKNTCIGIIKRLPSAQSDWNEMIVICDCWGHAIHVKRIDVER